MSSNRRNFLRNLTLGTGALAVGLPSIAAENKEDGALQRAYEKASANQRFNMSGYAAPKIDKVRVGIIGLGQRGGDAVQRLAYIDGLEIKALCDKYPDRVTKAQAGLEKRGFQKPKEYSGNDGWKAMIENEDLDLVYICTPWSLHTPMAVYAMNHGKHAACEVPIAKTLDECWELVETSEKTRKHCMMLENCCYDFFELLTLNMARNGLFGELVHAEGAYIHDLRSLNFSKDGYADMWRLKENYRNGNLYPTHGLGPIAQCLNINRGDKMEHLVSMSTNDFMMGQIANEKAATDPFYNEFAGKQFRGDMNTTLIHTEKGKTIMVQHDVTTPRPYSRIHLISGTKGVASKYPTPERIAFGHEWLKEEEMKALYDQYTPPIVKHVGEIAKKVGGHGGMDFIMDWRLIDCLRNGLPLDQDVYDGALWSSIAPLSERSVAKRSRTVDVPDFTRGAWKSNKPVNLTLEGGGNTGVRKI
ncbi:Gfo/Idh/MocA family oxidoreductase [Chitinophagaceae bacterium LB-8]|uniref:Gfo/Idh/MocA family oxidoreductase n=1 Tax=Paraflavisolibacter caeni TaxID=2982496 RepID=A0A9X3BJB3_9BACT|nr:Gfo/Idh/MocA family oxidoreductase [Paraflavisolibacter caeni]MCU7552577.1 Gfo/Idh/MocA family oxidoreductase [Paraflavisolibacter caeni]